MYPILVELEIGGMELVLPAYGTFMVLAVAVALVLAVRAAAQPPVGLRPRRAVPLFAAGIVAGLVGARLLDVALDVGAYADNPALVTALEPRGFALAGGCAAAGGVVVWGARHWGVPVGALADSAVVPVAAGIVLLRIGCFLNGCCAGEVTTVPWAVTFPYGSSAWSQQVLSGEAGIVGLAGHVEPVHPTQLYEAAAVVLSALVALLVRDRAPRAGTAAMAFVAVFLAFRAANQVLRPDSLGATLAHEMLVGGYAVAALAAVILLAVHVGRPARPVGVQTVHG